MERNKVLAEIENYLKIKKFIKGPISMDLSFVDDIGMDSLDMLEMFNVLEKKFRIRPLENETEKYKTVLDLVIAISKEIERKKEKAFPPKGNGNYYLADGYSYCAFTDKPCDKIDLANVSAHNYNQCERLKCSVWMHNNNQKTK